MKKITQDELKTLFIYEEDTGNFIRKTTNNRRLKIGTIAGTLDIKGYVHINISGVIYKAHRLAWLYINGDFPVSDIDHINGIKNDNRIKNLRVVSHSVNTQNIRKARSHNKSGFLGVTKNGKKWSSKIVVNGKYKLLGTHESPEIANHIYLSEKRKSHLGCTI